MTLQAATENTTRIHDTQEVFADGITWKYDVRICFCSLLGNVARVMLE